MIGYAVCIFLAVSTIQADETRSSQETNITRAEIKNQIRPKNLKAATKEIEDLNTEITMMQKQIALLEATNQSLSNYSGSVRRHIAPNTHLRGFRLENNPSEIDDTLETTLGPYK